jgi:hypothetical protein
VNEGMVDVMISGLQKITLPFYNAIQVFQKRNKDENSNH